MESVGPRGWFLYLLRCADGSLYTGVTTHLERRLDEHNAGRGSRYTAGRRPVWLIGAWRCASRSDAQRAEARLRRMSRAEKERVAMAGQSLAGAAFCGPTTERFCPRCGAALEITSLPDDEHPRHICLACGRIHYRNAKPCAGGLVTQNERLLLVRRAIEPFRGYWDIPGGFLEEGEHPAHGAVREVREETGLQVQLTDFFGFYLDQYVYQEEWGFILNIYFLAQVVGGAEQPGDDAVDLAWFAPDRLPTRIAFAHARRVLDDWIRSLRVKPAA